ncbi:hypothetical protein DFS34DRAFT_584595 [Phlyctochytrium arcticum]|nr:hypothetical protein DFS34DRAFT_584595 [Phlyctochytrium arcticum]
MAQITTPALPDCLPNQIDCLMTKSQYTILGTVVSNNMNDTTTAVRPLPSSTNYNATIMVNCVYSSFSNNKGTGAGLAGQAITVTGFGNPRPSCPQSLGAVAEPGQSSIFFVYVSSMVAAGNIPLFTVFNPCGGGIPFSDTNLQTLSNILQKNPANAITGVNRGSANCTLPNPVIPPTTTAPPTSTPTGGAGNNPLVLDNAAAGSILTSYASIMAAVAAGLIAMISLRAM